MFHHSVDIYSHVYDIIKRSEFDVSWLNYFDISAIRQFLTREGYHWDTLWLDITNVYNTYYTTDLYIWDNLSH